MHRGSLPRRKYEDGAVCGLLLFHYADGDEYDAVCDGVSSGLSDESGNCDSDKLLGWILSG